MATVTITGGTGLIGAALTKKLLEKGHDVIVLTRHQKPSKGKIQYKVWDVQRGQLDATAITEADYLVHLAGANVADGRWSEKRKKEIVDSRVKSGELLTKTLNTEKNHVKTVISASAIGWYGPDPQIPNPRPFQENDKAATDFLGATCQQWEASIQPVTSLGKRLVIFRTGVVLSNAGGAYAEFRKPVNFGAATILGNGNQIISWIHIDDVVRLYLAAMEDTRWQGIYNAVAPKPVSNKELILAIAQQKGSIYIPFQVPSFALRIALGEMSVEVLKSATVSAQKAEAEGFTFLYPTIGKAVAALQHEA